MLVTIQGSDVDLESDIRTIQLFVLTGHTFCHVNIVGTKDYIEEFTHCFQCRNLSQSSIMDVRTSRRRYGQNVRSAVSDNLQPVLPGLNFNSMSVQWHLSNVHDYDTMSEGDGWVLVFAVSRMNSVVEESPCLSDKKKAERII